MISEKKAFTLVELIVVIAIVAVLGTIAFISYLNFISLARDSKRIESINILNTGLELFFVKAGIFPDPSESIPVTLSGSIVAVQGDLGASVMRNIGASGDLKDPLDDQYYTYFVSGNKGQVGTFLENSRSDTFSSSKRLQDGSIYSNRYSYFSGHALGMILGNNNMPIHKVDSVISAGSFDILDLQFSNLDVQYLYSNKNHPIVPAIMIGGQLYLNQKKGGYEECPEHFVAVPGNDELGQPPFCIGKYEAYADGGDYDGVYQTAPGESPLFGVANNTIGPDCRGNGDGYHMMTFLQWLTIARNIEQQSRNWSGGEVGIGYIYGGNNGNTTTGFNTGGRLNTGTTGNPSEDALRQLYLSNGEVVWDFIGNVWEIVKPLNIYGIPSEQQSEVMQAINATGNLTYRNALQLIEVDGIGLSSTYYDWGDLSDQDFVDMYGPRTTLDRETGIGTFRQNQNYSYWVGGDYSDSSGYENGLYSVSKNNTTAFLNVGIRCAYSY